jgi:restriction endonuclease S subunit
VSRGAVTREGYKKTELGWIPEDWEVKRLGELCAIDSENLSNNTSADYLFKYISLENIEQGLLKGFTQLSFKEAPSRARRIIQKNDVLLATVRPNLLSHYFVKDVITNWVCSTGFSVLRSENLWTNKFIFYHLFFKIIIMQIESFITGSNYPAINSSDVKSLKIPFPPLPEQKKIAEILSTWDEAIEKLNSYIEAKKKLKKALMQRLLTGKQRFKEFIVREGYKKTELGWIPEDWEVKRLGELGEINMCKRIFNHETTETGSIPFYKIGTFGKSPDSYISENLYNDYRKRFSFPKQGDILISATGTIGRIVVYDGKPAYFQDSNIVWINNHEILTLNKYLYHILKVIKYNTEGGTLQRLYNNILRSTPFVCPPLPEQKKIAEILSKADEEIDLLNQELEKLKMQKKGLMQKLLTGVWRVKL